MRHYLFNDRRFVVLDSRHRDLKLAKKLINEGADVNLCPQENKYASEDGVPPLYYATAARDAEIVRLLLNSGKLYKIQ